MNKQNEEKDGQIQVLEEELVICSIFGHTHLHLMSGSVVLKKNVFNVFNCLGCEI